MSILALERGSEAMWLQEQPVATDHHQPADRAAAIPIAGAPAALTPDHVKWKQRHTMTTTLSPKKETYTTPIPPALPPTSPSRVTVLVRRVRRFMASIPLEHELDTVNLRRELIIHNLQLK